jgi:hypothetical protein
MAEGPDFASNDGDAGAKHGFGEGHPGTSAAFAADTTANEYMQAVVVLDIALSLRANRRPKRVDLV